MDKNITHLLHDVRAGFDTLSIPESYKMSALGFLEQWLTGEEFLVYAKQIEHLIQSKQWDYLLDSFYQVIPFGTSGRRGEVGVGPNRINTYTIQASAQGHSQFLIKRYGEHAKSRGVVCGYDVRQFVGNAYLSLEYNPLLNKTSKDFAHEVACVYAANGITVRVFPEIRTTPELSFAIRHLNAVSGVMISASHNPPDHNGKKVYDEFGGQLIAPDDEDLVDEVTENVRGIQIIDFDEAQRTGLIAMIGPEVDEAYINSASQVSLSSERNVKIVYTPLHGCGMSSVEKVLTKLGFIVEVDPKTEIASGRFENITFTIPNPEVVQSFDTTLIFADHVNADIIISSDPDADRIGIMVRHQNTWVFMNGNEIASILAAFVAHKNDLSGKKKGVMIKTIVTTNLMTNICAHYGYEIQGELLIGFKYIAYEMNKLERGGRSDEFLFACEESHGYLAGNYARDKDAAVPAIWLSECAAELKREGKTLVDYLNQVYEKFGYYRNYLNEIRLLGAEGKDKIQKFQSDLRTNPPQNFGIYRIARYEDCLDRTPILSTTDKVSKDILIFHLMPTDGVESMRVTVRPSNTEPKIKIYFEIGGKVVEGESLADVKLRIESLRSDLEKIVMKTCYEIIGVDFPDRGFLLFWQLPLDTKLKYFEIEPNIAMLVDEPDLDVRKQKLSKLLSFLGPDPIQKVDDAFEAEFGKKIQQYMGI